MASSSEIAQMFATQQSMFMGQNQYAQQIGVGAPSLAGWGGGGINTRGAFSYGAPSPAVGFGGGNRFAGGVMSAVGGVASIGAGMAFDPVGAFMGGAAGGLARGGIGAAIGGGMAAAALPMALGFGAQQGIGAVIRGGQQQSMMNTVLGQNFGHFNPMSRSGAGFSRDDAKAIGDSVRSLAHIPEMMTSVEELTRLMPKLKASGVMQGVKSAAEFQSRFKEAVGTIRDMSKILGSTMEEAEQFFAHSRSVGFTGRAAQLKNALNLQVTAGLTGMSTGQAAQMQSAGADMAMQFGAKRGLGVNAVTNIAQRIGLAQQNGGIREGLIEDVTGLSGAEGVQAASQRLGGFMMQMSKTAPGRAIMAGAAKFNESGQAIGLDDDVIRRLNEGSMSVDELKNRGSNLTGAQKISFQHRAANLGVELAGKVNMGRFVQGLVGNKGADAAGLTLSNLTGGQMSSQDTDLLLSLRSGGSEGQLQEMAKFRQEESKFKDRTDPGAILRRLKTRMSSTLFGGLESKGAEIHSALGNAYEEFTADVLNRHVVQLTKEGADKLTRAMSGGSKAELREVFAAAHGFKGGSSAATGGYGVGAIGLSLAMNSSMGKEVSAFLSRDSTNTGRDALGQLARGKELIGSKAAAERLNAGFGSSAAAGDIESATTAIEGFRHMTDDRKLDEMRSILQSRVREGVVKGAGPNSDLVRQGVDALMAGDKDRAAKYFAGSGFHSTEAVLAKLESSSDPSSIAAARIIRAGQSAVAAGARDAYTGAIAAGQGAYNGGYRQLNFAKARGSSSAANLDEMVKQAEQASKDSVKAMRSAKLGDSTISLITSSPSARKILANRNDPAVKKALDYGDPMLVAKALKSLGHDVSESDVEMLLDARDQMDHGTSQGKAVDQAVQAFEKGQGLGDYLAITKAFKSKAFDLDESIKSYKGTDAEMSVLKKVQSSLKAVGEGSGDIESVQGSIVELTKKAATIKDPKARAAFLKAAGTIGEAVQDTLSNGAGLSGKVTQQQVMDRFGISGKEAAAALERVGIHAGTGGTIGKGGVSLEDLEATVSGFKSSGAIASAGKVVRSGESTGDPLVDLLKKMDKNADTTNTILVAIGTALHAEMGGITVTKTQDATNESGKAHK